MKRYLFILLCSLIAMLTSCMEELGNYDYTNVNTVTIDSIKSTNITQFDTLRIHPTITQTLEENEDNLEYLWYWFKTGDEKRIIDTLSYDRDLIFYVAAEPGLYSARLKVTDKKTGLFSRKEFDVSIESDNSGVLILSNLNGKANLSVLNFARLYFQDVYYASNGEYAGENPIAVVDVDHEQTDMHYVIIMCKDSRGGVVADPAIFRKDGDFSSLFYGAPKTIDPQGYNSCFGEYTSGRIITYDFIINAGKLYNRDFYNAGIAGNLLFRPEIIGDYELSPYAFVNGNSLLFYDNKNCCFQVLQCRSGQILTSKFSMAPVSEDMDVETMAFDPANVGLELVYGGEGWKKEDAQVGSGYGIFRKPGSTSLEDMYCLKFQIGTKMSYVPPYGDYFVPYFKKKVMKAVHLNEANAYALSKKDPYLYYSYKNKIYSYDLEYDIVKEIYDTDTVVGPGAIVDYMYFRNANNGDYTQKMWAASSKPGATEKTGSIHVFDLGRNGDVVRVDSVYHDVCGRVVSMSYKNR